jgi:hypothetical protein
MTGTLILVLLIIAIALRWRRRLSYGGETRLLYAVLVLSVLSTVGQIIRRPSAALFIICLGVLPIAVVLLAIFVRRREATLNGERILPPGLEGRTMQ